MIRTWSKFNYGHTIDTQNQFICFSEGAGELVGTIPVGNYTLGEFADAVQDAFNGAGDLTYTVTLSRATNRLTIAASGNFTILLDTGTVSATAYELMGFSQIVDLTGDDSYTGESPSGSEYFPQFYLQSYVPPENWIESVDATVNKSADGRVEVVRFGLERKMEMDIKFITNLPMDGVIIRNNPTGLARALDYLSYVSQKKKFEFIPDTLNPSTFHKVILEKAPGYDKGTGFKLRELFGQNLPDVYETGVITLRVIA
jgi:hypothetical protein